MKLSAVVLLSVNLVAASQVAANAADTASFLQDTLASSSTGAAPSAEKKATAPKAAQAESIKKRSYVAMTPVIDGVKMRPFMPGRYLPSEAELQAKKQAEIAAQQAPVYQSYNGGQSGVLSGQVSSNNQISASNNNKNNYMSELGSVVAPAAAYALSRPVTQDYIRKVAQATVQKVKQATKNYESTHPRAVPGMNAILPGQIAKLPGAAAAIPELLEQQVVGLTSVTTQVPQPPSRASFPIQGRSTTAPIGTVPQPELTNYEANQLDRLVESNAPENVYAQGSNADMRVSAQGNPAQAGAGTAAFPLSAMPMNQGNGRGHNLGGPVTQARFGSWHGGSSGLTQASFQSYVPIHMTGPMSVRISQHGSSHHTSSQMIAMGPHYSSSHHLNAQSTKSTTETQKKTEPHAASYPPYRRYD